MSALPQVAVIAAADLDRAIGRNNAIPWHIRDDMLRFRELTMGKIMLMGRRTFESLGCRCLPGRISVVLTSDLSLGERYHVRCFTSAAEALDTLTRESSGELMIIGGGKVYAELLPFASRLYFTRVLTRILDADTFFPPFEDTFTLEAETRVEAGVQNDFPCLFQDYVRKGDC